MATYKIERFAPNGTKVSAEIFDDFDRANCALNVWVINRARGERFKMWKFDGSNVFRVMWNVTAYNSCNGYSATKDFDDEISAKEAASFGLYLDGWNVTASVRMFIRKERGEW